MNAFIDDGLVALVLLAGFGYAIYSLGPRSLRTRLLIGAAALLRRIPTAATRNAAQRMATTAGKAKASCGGCDTCGSNAAADARPSAGSDSPPDIKIPLATIGRRRRD